MKSRIILTILSLLNLSAEAQQDTFSQVLLQIEQNSTTLQTLQKKMEAQKTAYRTGLTPRAPEVQFGYLFGSPSHIGDRKDVSIRQVFDFPSVYARRNRIANQQGALAEWQYRSERMQLLLRAKQTCIRLVCCNAQIRLFQQQTNRALRILDTYNRMFQQGMTNKLEQHKAKMHLAMVESSLDAVRLEQSQLLAELQAMNGGQPISVNDTAFAVMALPMSFEDYLSDAESNNPKLLYMLQQKNVAYDQIGLARSSSLPQLSVGYIGEFERDNMFQGITVGLSIPLWENKNRVRQAQQHADEISKHYEDVWLQNYMHLSNLYNQAVQLQRTLVQYESAFLPDDDIILLSRVFERGELPLLNYLLEQDYWTSAYNRLLQTKRDLALVVAELNAWKL